MNSNWLFVALKESSWSPTSSSSAHSSGLSVDGGGGSSSMANPWGDGGSDIHTIHTFVRKARANKGKSIHRTHSDSTLLDKMRLKDSLYASQAGAKAERKKEKKLKKLSLGSGMTAQDSGSSEGEKRARIKRSKNSSKQPKAKKLKSSAAHTETDSEARKLEVQAAKDELSAHGSSSSSTQWKPQPDESIRDAEMSSSEGETWIADEDIMVESGTTQLLFQFLPTNQKETTSCNNRHYWRNNYFICETKLVKILYTFFFLVFNNFTNYIVTQTLLCYLHRNAKQIND